MNMIPVPSVVWVPAHPSPLHKLFHQPGTYFHSTCPKFTCRSSNTSSVSILQSGCPVPTASITFEIQNFNILRILLLPSDPLSPLLVSAFSCWLNLSPVGSMAETVGEFTEHPTCPHPLQPFSTVIEFPAFLAARTDLVTPSGQ